MQEKLITNFREIISSIGEDLNRDGLKKTPERAASAFEFLTQKVTEGAMAVVPGVSSFGNYLTRMSDQNVYEYAITGSQDQWFRETFDVEAIGGLECGKCHH